MAKDPEERPEPEEVARALEGVAGERRPEPEPQPEPEPEPGPGPSAPEDAVPQAEAAPPPARRTLLRIAVAPLGILLAGGIWLGTSFADGTTGQGEGWVAHREQGMSAVLNLPSRYLLLYEIGEAGDDHVMSVYSDNRTLSVQFTEWDKAPASPMAAAKETAVGMEGHERTGGQYTATTFHGQEAVLSDVTYDPHGDDPVRVMRLVVRTDDDRMYQLDVHMPKGTPDEKKGTALFKGARDRLEIG